MADLESATANLGTRPSARGRALILLSFVAMMGIACLCPAFYLDNVPYVWRGIHVLVLGVIGLKAGHLGWLANLPVLFALRGVMQGWGWISAVLSVSSMLLALHTLTVFGRDLQVGPQEYNVVHVVALGPGFYLWLLTLLHPFLIFLILRQAKRRILAKDFAG